MATEFPVRMPLAAVAIGILASLCCLSSATAELPFGLLDQTGCCMRCPACDHVCKLDAEEIKDERLCFRVESKVVCIPRVVFPWQLPKHHGCQSCRGRGCSACVHNGARTRRVCVLVEDSYECPMCLYTWSAEKRASRRCHGCVGKDSASVPEPSHDPKLYPTPIGTVPAPQPDLATP